MALLQIILATFLVSLISLIGVISIFVKERSLNKNLFLLISLSIGGLLGGALLHLIPEALDAGEKIFLFIIIGFLSFFIIEKLFHWRHCHKNHCSIHSFAYVNLLGDVIHNFIDGVIIAASFIAGYTTGIITTLAITLHEIPQELGDFGVLVYSGFTRKKALAANFLTALTALLGGVAGYFLLSYLESLMPYLLAFAAGGFIYIAASDLLPEIKKLESMKHTLVNLLMILLGILLIVLVGFLE